MPTSDQGNSTEHSAVSFGEATRNIDAVLVKLRPGGHSDRAATLAELSSQIVSIDPLPRDLRNIPPVKAVFRPEISPRMRRLAGATFLRLITIDEGVFAEPHEKMNLAKLFDDTLAADVYTGLQINVSDQNYSKIARLRQAVSEAEHDLRSLPSLIKNVSAIPGARREFMRRSHRPMARHLLLGFVPRSFLEKTAVDEVLSKAERFINAAKTDKLAAFRAFESSCNDYVAGLRQVDTLYVVECLLPFFEKVLDTVQNDFRSSAFSKPAVLEIEALDKKYPFKEEGATFPLTFNIRNTGEGHAFDIRVDFDLLQDLQAPRRSLYLGELGSGEVIGDVDLPVTVVEPQSVAALDATVCWTNVDGTPATRTVSLSMMAQTSVIDWEELEYADPYSLEPVTDEQDLVGRTDVLNELSARLAAKKAGSFVVYGQKRVGKTSVVKTLRSKLLSVQDSLFTVIYLESGSYVHPDPEKTIEQLGTALCEEVKRSDTRLAHLTIPEFAGALSPVDRFLAEVQSATPNKRLIFILDEFDELPIAIYKTRPNPFFQTLRSLSARDDIGFVLVGGEKMQAILNAQGDVLNKFRTLRLDYFDREKHWSDFNELVHRPVRGWFAITDEATAVLYDESAGNPFFTKLIAGQMFQMMVKRRDSFVTARDVHEAVKEALPRIGHQPFQHFWEDGILEEGDKQKEKSIIRRRVLLAIGEGLRQHETISKEELHRFVHQYDVPDLLADSELDEFVRRQILTETHSAYKCKVALFSQWLKEIGLHEILTEYADKDKMLQRKRDEELVRVRPDEIHALIKTWGMYKGRHVTEENVRCWLDQFGSNADQRLAFRILQGIKFYTADNIRGKMAEAHGIVARRLAHHGYARRLVEKQRKRGDLIVSYLGGPEKSGAEFASLYQEENDIYANCVVERGALAGVLAKKQKGEVGAIVFIDDLIGTGRQASTELTKVIKECGTRIDELDLLVMLVVLTGFQEAQEEVERQLRKLDAAVEIRICDPLSESDRYFSDTSKVFPDATERLKAETLATTFGSQLVRDHALGFGGAQARTIFEFSCPNDVLPILWSTSNNWIPLFKR